MNAANANPRAVSVQILLDVLVKKQSLTRALDATSRNTEGVNMGLVQEFCFGTLRWYHQLCVISTQLLNKPLKKKDQDLQLLILLGLYQLKFMSIPAHAVLSETVDVSKELKKEWARGLVNAILRGYQRNEKKILEQIKTPDEACYSHPDWLIREMQSSWPACWKEILDANNQRPPMNLRVNKCKNDRASYLGKLAESQQQAELLVFSDTGIKLDSPVAVDKLPGFAQGLASVQDGAAQLAAPLLQLEAEHRVLDACAAPGGKTCHILENQPLIKELVALDIDKARVRQIEENLVRLQLMETTSVSLLVVDASDPGKKWWNGELFDRILLDAPCSATGVIRRHPDIKILRQEQDIDELVALQGRMLTCMWSLLKPGGKLLYATCSVIARENHLQIVKFLKQNVDAKEDLIEASWGRKQPAGRQILPGEGYMDGFYYARLTKDL